MLAQRLVELGVRVQHPLLAAFAKVKREQHEKLGVLRRHKFGQTIALCCCLCNFGASADHIVLFGELECFDSFLKALRLERAVFKHAFRDCLRVVAVACGDAPHALLVVLLCCCHCSAECCSACDFCFFRSVFPAPKNAKKMRKKQSSKLLPPAKFRERMIRVLFSQYISYRHMQRSPQDDCMASFLRQVLRVFAFNIAQKTL